MTWSTLSASKVKVEPSSRLAVNYNLLVYTALTFLLVGFLYLAKDWKGYTSPEEVDLGTVRVPSHTCRRKYGHYRRH